MAWYLMGASQGKHGREDFRREERCSILVPLRIDDLAAIRKTLHHLPQIADAVIAVFVPVPHHACRREEFGPQRMRLWLIVDREDEQSTVPADACHRRRVPEPFPY